MAYSTNVMQIALAGSRIELLKCALGGALIKMLLLVITYLSIYPLHHGSTPSWPLNNRIDWV